MKTEQELENKTLFAPLGSFHLGEVVTEMKAEESWEKTGRSAKTLLKTNGMRIVANAMKAGTAIKPHYSKGPISVQCLEGELKFLTDSETVNLKPGNVLTLEANVRHSVEAIEETCFLLTISLFDEKVN